MKKAGKRIAAWLTALALCAGMLPAVAFAEETPAGAGAPASVTESENTSALAATPGEAPVTTAAQSAPAPAAPRVAEGDADLVWDEATKTLTYTGTSFDADLSDLPYEAEIEHLVLDNPEMAVFRGNANYHNTTLKTLVINSAKTVGTYAFTYYDALERVELYNCGSIDTAFQGNASIQTALIDTVDTIGPNTFMNVKTMKELTIRHVTGSMRAVFPGCANLEKAEITDVENIAGLNGAQTVILKDIGTISANAALVQTTLKELILEDVDLIGEHAFDYCIGLTSVTAKNVVNIDEYAFYRCAGLKTVDLQNCGVVQGKAFNLCTGLESFTFTEGTQLGYSSVFDLNDPKFAAIKERMEGIMAGTFELGEAKTQDDALAPDAGFESSRTGKENDTAIGGTQLTKAAKWADAEQTAADVQFQYRYAQAPGKDFLFVLDLSASMSDLGTDDSMNGRMYEMQSKMLEVTDDLLNTAGYDNRVGIVTFGGYKNDTNPTKITTTDFTTDSAAIHDAVYAARSEESQNTDYLTALDEAAKLIAARTDTSRQVEIIFISDGEPTVDADKNLYRPVGETTAGKEDVGTENWYAMLDDIRVKAQALKAQGVDIIGVLQTPSEADIPYCEDAMEAVCLDGAYYIGTDTEGFSRAVNNAIATAYSVHVLVDTVDPAFTLDESSITATAGSWAVGTDAAGNTTITWTITGVPFTTHTLRYRLALKPEEDGSYAAGAFDTNEGDAQLYPGTQPEGTAANAVATPTLLRGTVLVQPADITIYMGGSEGYEGVVNGSDGTLGKTDNSLPEPGFYVTLPDAVNELLQAETGVAGAADLSQYMTVRTVSGDRVWTLEQYGATNSVAYDKFIYRIVAGDGQDPVRLEFRDEAGNLYISDSFEPSEAGALTQEYTMGIYAGAVDLGNVVVDITVGGKTYTLPVRTETGTLDVRYVTGEQADVVTGVVSDIAAAAREDGKAYAEMPADTVYTINASDVDVTAEAAPSLLFDDVVSTANTAGAQDNATLVRTYALETLADVGLVNPQYEAKYLDLVDANNGNAWLTASNPVKVYWPYPDGTGEDTQFYLVHFEGLHRDMNNGDVEALVAAATKTRMQVTNTEYGISFETDGFSPFVLVWDAPKTTTPVTPGTSTGTTPQTGDASHAALWAGLLAVGALGVAGTGIAMSRSKRRKAR